MPTGLVTTWLEEKGFGFIAPDDSTFGDLFVHVSELRDARANGLERGDRVRFDVKYNREKGKNLAVNVIVEKSGGGASSGHLCRTFPSERHSS
ncbi:Probable cold shock protein A [Durusdinium trenchii]|uniref:Probable cold shock protein A n=1 Tax=Durusdinium trenchii TaxID=1381693 RepID=A0ABP0SER1_9DINO